MLTDADRILDLERQLEEQKAVADTSRKMWAVSKILYSQRNVALAEKQRQLQIDRSAMQVRMHIPLQTQCCSRASLGACLAAETAASSLR